FHVTGVQTCALPILAELGVPAVALFPKLDKSLKNDAGTAALADDALILRAVRAVKAALPELVVMTDIALDPYTTHGHDGLLTARSEERRVGKEVRCR